MRKARRISKENYCMLEKPLPIYLINIKAQITFGHNGLKFLQIRTLETISISVRWHNKSE